MRNTTKIKEKDKKNLTKKIKNRVKKLKNKKEKIEDLLIDGTFSKERFSEKIKKVESELESAIIELNELEERIVDIDEIIEYGKYFINNISNLWKRADMKSKKRFQDTLFPGKTYIVDGELRTTEIASIFKVFRDYNFEESDLAPRTERY